MKKMLMLGMVFAVLAALATQPIGVGSTLVGVHPAYAKLSQCGNQPCPTGGTGSGSGGSGSNSNCTNLGVGFGPGQSGSQVCGNGNTQLENYIKLLVAWANGVITILAVLMIAYGGIKYVYSMGNPDQIKDAKSTIIGALAGVFLLMISDILLLAINPTLLGPVKVIFGK